MQSSELVAPPEEPIEPGISTTALGLEPSLPARFRSGIIWNFITFAAGMGSTFLVNLMVANMLGKEAFGRFTMVQSTLVTFSGLASLSMGLAATKYVAEFRAQDKHRAGRVMALCFLVSVGMAGIVSAGLVASSHWIANSQLKSADLANALLAGVAFLFFASITGFQSGALAGLECYRLAGIANVLSGTLALAICSMSIRFYGLTGAFVGLSISAMLRFLIVRRFLAEACHQAGITFNYERLAELRGILLRFALPAAMSAYFTMPMFWLANLILFRQPNGAANMALYGAAASVRVMVLFLPNIINSVGVSILNHTKGTGDLRTFGRLYWNNVAVVVSTILLVALAVVLAGKLILSVFGKGFEDAYPVMLVMLVSAVAEGLSVSLFQMIQAHERMWFAFLCVIVPRELTLVGSSYLLAPKFGAIGLALSYTIAWSLAALITVVSVIRMKHHEWPGRQSCRDATP